MALARSVRIGLHRGLLWARPCAVKRVSSLGVLACLAVCAGGCLVDNLVYTEPSLTEPPEGKTPTLDASTATPPPAASVTPAVPDPHPEDAGDGDAAPPPEPPPPPNPPPNPPPPNPPPNPPPPNPPQACAGGTLEVEPNDILDSAQELPAGIRCGQLAAAADVDWSTVDPDGFLNLQFIASGDARLRIQNGKQGLISFEKGAGGTFILPTKARWYLKIWSPSGTVQTWQLVRK